MVGGSSPPGPASNIYIRKIMEKIKKFFNELKSEYEKVEWPSKNEIAVLTALVVFISVAVSLYLGAFDILFRNFLSRWGIL